MTKCLKNVEKVGKGYKNVDEKTIPFRNIKNGGDLIIKCAML